MQEWELACKEVGLKAKKLKTPLKTKFASKVVLFQDTLKFHIVIDFYLSQQTSKL
jgi:hypothetical protein